MAKYPCELFAHFYYSPKLTYEELHQKESELLQEVDLLLTNEGGIHLEFTPGSDSLAVQGELAEFNRKFSDRIAEQIRKLLPAQIEVRMLLVEKEDMGSVLLYSITPKKAECKETAIKRPFTGKE